VPPPPGPKGTRQQIGKKVTVLGVVRVHRKRKGGRRGVREGARSRKPSRRVGGVSSATAAGPKGDETKKYKGAPFRGVVAVHRIRKGGRRGAREGGRRRKPSRRVGGAYSTTAAGPRGEGRVGWKGGGMLLLLLRWEIDGTPPTATSTTISIGHPQLPAFLRQTPPALLPFSGLEEGGVKGRWEGRS